MAPLRYYLFLHGIEFDDNGKPFLLDESVERACWLDKIAGDDIAVMWYGPTQSVIGYSRLLGDELLTLYAVAACSGTAPFKDKETRARWTLAGRAVDRRLQ